MSQRDLAALFRGYTPYELELHRRALERRARLAAAAVEPSEPPPAPPPPAPPEPSPLDGRNAGGQRAGALSMSPRAVQRRADYAVRVGHVTPYGMSTEPKAVRQRELRAIAREEKCGRVTICLPREAGDPSEEQIGPAEPSKLANAKSTSLNSPTFDGE